MISEELLSLIVDKNVTKVEKPLDNNLNYFVDGNDWGDKINLDTLQRKCKEWCLKNNTKLWSIKDDKNSAICRINNIEKTEFYADTEQEAVIKATEYVARKKGLTK